VAVHSGGAASGGIADGLTDAAVGPDVADTEEESGAPDGGGVATGAALGADAQAATTRLKTIVVATCESEERIRCPPDGV